jgi:hypothetical protein
MPPPKGHGANPTPDPSDSAAALRARAPRFSIQDAGSPHRGGISTDFIAMAGSTDEARAIGDAQKRGVVSAKTERVELKRRGILGPDYNEDEEEQRLAEEQQGLESEEPMNPINGDVIPFDRAAP